MAALTSTNITTTKRSSHRRTVRTAAAAAGVALLVGLGAACTPEANHAANLVNETRANNGLPALQFNTMLYLKAQGWADQLARQNYLSHSRLADGNWSSTWTKLGENVGVAYSIEGVHNAFMNSPSHKANIVDRSYNKIGTGVHVSHDGRVWVVQEFMHEW